MCMGLRSVLMLCSFLLVAGCARDPGNVSTQQMIQESIVAMGGAEKLESIQLTVLQGSGTFTWLGEGANAGDPGPTATLQNLVEVYDYANGRAAFEYDLVSWYHTRRREVLTKYGEGEAARPVGFVWRPDIGAAVQSPEALYGFAYQTSPEIGMRRSYLNILLDISNTGVEGQTTEDREFDGTMRTFATAKTKQGEPLDLYFDPETKLLVGYEITETNPIMGDIRSTYTFEDFKPGDDVLFPHRLKIRGEARNAADIQYTSVSFGENALAEEMFTFPESLGREGTRATSGDYVPLQLFPVAPGVFQANGWSHSSMVVEFPRWLVVVEAPQGEIHSKVLDQLLKKQFPEKPVRYVAVTHPHHDHIGGVRAFAAWGATILVDKNHATAMKQIVDAPHSYPPDELERNRRSQQNVGGIEVYDGKQVISDGGRTLELYAIHPMGAGGDPSDTMVIAYLPSERVLFQSDLGGKPLFEAVTKLNLRPENMLSGHGAPQGLRPRAQGSGVASFAALARTAGGS